MQLSLRDDNLLLLHKGKITPPLIDLILESLEESVTNLVEDRKVKRKLTNVFIEAFQNVGYHGVKEGPYANTDMIIVVSRPGHYKIGTSNLIKKENIAHIKNVINEINGLDESALREKYKDALANNEVSEKGTAGLGFIDIARKTGQKLFYDFQELDENYAHFYFETKILKDYSAETSKRVSALNKA